MSTAARQPKPSRKGIPEAARRPPAWTTGARASPTFSAARSPSPRLPAGSAPPPQGIAFPPLGGGPPPSHPNGNSTPSAPAPPPDRVLQSLGGLTGTTITLATKTSQRYEGVVSSTSGEGNTTGVTLRDVREITTPGAPLKDTLFIASTNIDTWASGPADAAKVSGNGADSFRTDTDISGKAKPGRERELQAWQPAPTDASLPGPPSDDLTFGGGVNGTSWDQFAVNEKLFGVKTNFDEDTYTTKLDRSGADFKEREKRAQRLANEIIGGATSNPHIAEERNMNVDDSGVNEEDKYGAVVRSTGAYVPPGARRGSGPLSPPLAPASSSTPAPKPEVPKVAINGPDGAAIVDKDASPANKPPADPLPAFRDFVTNEKQRLTQKRQALVKSEMDKRMAELKKFSLDFKLNKPIPDDLVPILAKDEEKQKQIREKASKDASTTGARTIGINSVLNPTPNNNRPVVVTTQQKPAAAKASDKETAKVSATRPADAMRKGGIKLAVIPPHRSTVAAAAAAAAAAAPAKPAAVDKVAKPPISMSIQAIPPFRKAGGPANGNGNGHANGSGSSASTPMPTSPTTAARLNVNASSFRPNPKANTFSPITPTPNAASATSPRPKPAEPATSPNIFFGTRAIKKGPPVNIKDDFNPFKHSHNKVPEASTISALWLYSGKRYIQMFPPPQQHPPQPPAHIAPPGPPPMPPPSYEEDTAAQAVARGYVYAAPYGYGYPGQHMMPGMPPPGPPGAYMPGPYMQPMHYPPGMPPPNGQPMFSPGMGQMGPPQGYGMPPPQGQYPPPNGGPRPSMPPTPVPSHTHPYYHQSPQLQHAMPYPMMMPPPSNVPHPYDGGQAPPVQMGGHA
ncbi:hypothetical protein FIBSPDRAFT_918970 [Athelia psychrophila]|uniref:LsmAD domain-containing protein n=1 Tax=Athelia psychrophila TaxID=1759441 RepID=A0A166M9B6_9AGAM|nr:hypothetical protein FIBSPDRAFT_918970 [Fibularhizoctonia sp. CBS 109695]